MAGQLFCFNTTATPIFIAMNGGNQMNIRATTVTSRFSWQAVPLNPPIPFAGQISENILGYGTNRFLFGRQGDANPMSGKIDVPNDIPLTDSFQLYLAPFGEGDGMHWVFKEGLYFTSSSTGKANLTTRSKANG